MTEFQCVIAMCRLSNVNISILYMYIDFWFPIFGLHSDH